MSDMFSRCSGLTSLDVSNFDTSKVTDMSKMFYRCSGLTTIYVSEYNSTTGKGWTTENVTNSVGMFNKCTNLVGGNGTKYNSSYQEATYARIDTAETPGYLTEKGAATQAELNEDSTSWGNYYNNLWNITNTNSKYYANSTWTTGAYGAKTSSSNILLSTGAAESFSKMGIYDLAGNVWEWTLEYTSYALNPCATRGGRYDGSGSSYPASYCDYYNTTGLLDNVGFRLALY